MKILLQDTQTLKFIGPTAGWTKDPDEARNFQRGVDALIFCYNAAIPNMVMLFEFTDRRMNFRFPVTDYRGD